jgi:hypothetical protein
MRGQYDAYFVIWGLLMFACFVWLAVDEWRAYRRRRK